MPDKLNPAFTTTVNRPHLAIIAAVAKNGVIGINNQLPWRLPADLQRFRTLTFGHRVVMGRKTYESLGRPLPGRENVVVTRNASYSAPGCTVVTTVEASLVLPSPPGTIFCIGGAELYRQAFPLADLLYLTEIQKSFPGDTYFPVFDRNEWLELTRDIQQAEGVDGFYYHFVLYERATNNFSYASSSPNRNFASL